MAEPKLEVEKRLDRHEEAIITLAQQLLNADNMEEIEEILQGRQGEDDASEEPSAA